MPEIITRAEALAHGLNRYLTGKPCSNGHITERSASWGYCLECKRCSWRRLHPKRPIGMRQCRVCCQDFLPGSNRAIVCLSPDCIKERKQASFSSWYRRKGAERNLRKRNELQAKDCMICGALFCTRIKTVKCCANCKSEFEKTRAKVYQLKWKKENSHVPYHGRDPVKALERQRRYRAKHGLKSYYEGPSNPKDEMQWLRKNQAQLRKLRRTLRNLGASQSPSEA